MARVVVDLSAPWLRQYPRAYALLVRAQLGVIIKVNRVSLATDRTLPKLYRSGVRYREEPPDYDSFVDIYEVLKAGHGDCAHLCAWRVAELIHGGEIKATLIIEWRDWSDEGLDVPRLFHVQVRRADGRIEDPSRLLGMGKIS